MIILIRKKAKRQLNMSACFIFKEKKNETHLFS